MSALTVPERLLASVGDRPGDVPPHWVNGLPAVVRDVAERWSLRVGPAFEPGGRCSWAAPVRDARGRARVLKLGWRHTEAEHEAVALTVWAGAGAVRLHASESVGHTSALLLERCRPGTALAHSVVEPDQDPIIAGLLGRLWDTPVAGTGLRPLEDMCDQWVAEYQAQGSTGSVAADPGLARLAASMVRDLPRSAPARVLLSTDLHAENVLAAQREPWLVIDPKPYVGDPTYDVLQHMLNCQRRLSADPARLCRRMAELSCLDYERVTQWLFGRAMLGSAQQPWLYEVACRVAP